MDKLKKIWKFLWKDDSLLSWVVNIVLAFVLVKFIIYPGIGLLMGTGYPVVAVVSGSMEHEGSFDDWWDWQGDWYLGNDISEEDFLDFPFKNGFNKGDIMVLVGVDIENIDIGDVVVFDGVSANPIIHRVVDKDFDDEWYVSTKGDHNTDSYLQLGEDRIDQERIIGKAIVRVPLLGWIKIVAVEIFGVFS